jgi:hypothetical protein
MDTPFTLRDVSVAGSGLSPEFEDATSDEILAASYGEKR